MTVKECPLGTARFGSRVRVASEELANLPTRGSVSEWPKEAGCKPAGIAYGGSNPPRPTSGE